MVSPAEAVFLSESNRIEEYQTLPVRVQGYAEPALYLQRCERRNDDDAQQKFSLKFALNSWRTELASGWLASRLGMKPRCLIQGSASAGNVDSLIRFLHDQGIPAPEIHVIDLIDLKGLGYADPRAQYHRADAADLSDLFVDGSLDLLLQDHLLNCAPVCHYDSILAEVRRILDPAGLAFLHYTDPSRFPSARGNSIEHLISSEGPKYRLDMTDSMLQACFSMSPAERLIETADGFIIVTLPFGNLEHFIPFDSFAARLTRAGLKLESRRIVNIIDGEGLDCRRNLCLAMPCRQ